MPTIDAQDVIGKTIYPKNIISFWKGSQLTTGDLKDKDRAGTLPIGFPFKVWSFAAPTSTRKNLYWMAKDNQGKIFIVRHSSKDFSFKRLAQQGVKTEEQKLKEQEESEKTLTDKLADIFKDTTKFLKYIVIAGLGIYAIGYLAPKFKK